MPAHFGPRRSDTDLACGYDREPAGPAVGRLADLGVRRISVGSLLYRRALGAALEAVADIAAGRAPGGTVPTYDEVQALGDPA